MIAPVVDSVAARILVVEDTHVLATYLRQVLTRAGFEVALADDHASAMALIERPEEVFDAAVLDHELPDGDSRSLVTALADRDPPCSALILTGRGDQGLARQYQGRGAFLYVSKPLYPLPLIGHVYDTIRDTQRWRNAGRDEPPSTTPPPVVVDVDAAADRLRHIAGLSPTEREVAYWVLQGLRDSQIAEKLGRAERTAKRHVGQLLAKSGAQNRASLWEVLRHDSRL